MRRLTQLELLAGVLLAAGAALAQQGFIVEPWQNASATSPVATPAPPAPTPTPAVALPASGLPLAAVEPATSAPADALPLPNKWSPPVVQLLVDPWAKSAAPAAAPRPRWVPADDEIVDPWAASPAATPTPRLASRAADKPRSTIF